MLCIRKILRSKLRFSFGKQDGNGNGKDNTNSSRVNTAINDEYKEAFRTKSYAEISNKIQSQLETRIVPSDASSPPPAEHIHLSEYLVEPRRETLISISKHHLLTDYFATSLEAGTICESILQKIHQIRADHRVIISSHHGSRLSQTLAAFALGGNPFAAMTAQRFRDLRGQHERFLRQLTCKREKKKKEKRFARLMAAVRGRGRGGVEAQLDAAARGVYILMNDFDTASRMVGRLREEMERRKAAAGAGVGRGEMMEVVRGFQLQELGFMEQLEELEKQIYLCFLDINRSRRLLIQELDK